VQGKQPVSRGAEILPEPLRLIQFEDLVDGIEQGPLLLPASIMPNSLPVKLLLLG